MPSSRGKIEGLNSTGLVHWVCIAVNAHQNAPVETIGNGGTGIKRAVDVGPPCHGRADAAFLEMLFNFPGDIQGEGFFCDSSTGTSSSGRGAERTLIVMRSPAAVAASGARPSACIGATVGMNSTSSIWRGHR